MEEKATIEFKKDFYANLSNFNSLFSQNQEQVFLCDNLEFATYDFLKNLNGSEKTYQEKKNKLVSAINKIEGKNLDTNLLAQTTFKSKRINTYLLTRGINIIRQLSNYTYFFDIEIPSGITIALTLASFDEKEILSNHIISFFNKTSIKAPHIEALVLTILFKKVKIETRFTIPPQIKEIIDFSKWLDTFITSPETAPTMPDYENIASLFLNSSIFSSIRKNAIKQCAKYSWKKKLVEPPKSIFSHYYSKQDKHMPKATKMLILWFLALQRLYYEEFEKNKEKFTKKDVSDNIVNKIVFKRNSIADLIESLELPKQYMVWLNSFKLENEITIK